MGGGGGLNRYFMRGFIQYIEFKSIRLCILFLLVTYEIIRPGEQTACQLVYHISSFVYYGYIHLTAVFA